LIVGNIATYPARSVGLEEVVNKLSPQVDRLNVILNEYGEIPVWFQMYSNVTPIIPEEDLKDVGKFMPRVGGDDIVVLFDDDLNYPDDYVSQMIVKANAVGAFSGPGLIAGLHGTIYKSPLGERSLRAFARVLVRGAWRTGSFRKMFNYWSRLDRATVVEQIGTGTAVLPGRLLPGLDVMETSKRRTDVCLAAWSFENDIPMVALPREKNWLTCSEQDDSIYASYTQRMPKELSEEISRFAGKNKSAGSAWKAERKKEKV
jgi:hypothetical protein